MRRYQQGGGVGKFGKQFEPTGYGQQASFAGPRVPVGSIDLDRVVHHVADQSCGGLAIEESDYRGARRMPGRGMERDPGRHFLVLVDDFGEAGVEDRLHAAAGIELGLPADLASREQPRRRVAIGRSIASGRYEVTIAQFATFAADAGYAPEPGCWQFVGSTWTFDKTRSWKDSNLRCVRRTG